MYEAGLLALEQYARAVRSELTPHLKLVIGQISKKMTMGKMRDRLTEVRLSSCRRDRFFVYRVAIEQIRMLAGLLQRVRVQR